MKVRMDFVTNSSSSSFLIAQKKGGKLSQVSRDKLADLLIREFMDRVTILEDLTVENAGTHEMLEYRYEDDVDEVVTALKEGFQIGEGYISWDEAEENLTDIFAEVLDILDNDEAYRVIEDDLSY